MFKNKDGLGGEDLARIVRWVLLLFFAFVLLDSVPSFWSSPTKPTTTTEATSAKTPEEKAHAGDCSGNVFNNFSLMSIPLFPVSSPAVAISDISVGKGEAAACGQRATLRYTYATRNGDIIFSNMKTGDETRDVRLGSAEMLPGLERGLLGMKVGGERDISIPPQLGFSAVKREQLRDHDKFKFSDTASVLTARATLLSLSPEQPKTAFPLRIVEHKLGNEKPVECGDNVSIKLTLWKLDGTSLYSNETSAPLTFTLGASQVPYGVEQGVIGMMAGGKRTLIIPPSYLAPLDKKAGDIKLKDVKLPMSEITMAIIELLPEDKTTTEKK